MRVVVAGAGIGGLALAQGVRRHGIEVVVLEPDTDLARTGGDKLHLGVAATAALRELLDARRVERRWRRRWGPSCSRSTCATTAGGGCSRRGARPTG